MKIVPLCILSGLAACHSEPPPIPKHLLNVEVMGSPKCLGEIMAQLTDINVGLARSPVWSKGIGRMEVGPIDRSKLRIVIATIGKLGCAKGTQTRPCATPYTDVKVCPDEESERSANTQVVRSDWRLHMGRWIPDRYS